MRDPGSELEQLREQNLYRELRHGEGKPGRELLYDHSSLINFSSNDYLGFAADDALKNAVEEAIIKYGVGSGSSRMVSGGSAQHRKIETATAKFFNNESALFFANGYNAAIGTLGALLKKGDTVILDKLCHASLIDGARLSEATIRVFPHNNLEKLKSILTSINKTDLTNKRTLIVTEGVFSMDGDIPPLRGIVELKEQFNALLLVDEAHSFGVIGPDGRGLSYQEGIAQEVDFLMATFGKAAGAAGGTVVASKRWIELIINRARSFIYSTAPLPAQAAAALAGLRLIQGTTGKNRRELLKRNITHFCEELDINRPHGAILPIIIGDERQALNTSKCLLKSGLLAPAIRYPTVAKGSARLRITISASHTEQDITNLTRELRTLLVQE